MQLTILGRRWELVECDGRELPGKWGECDDGKPPGTCGRKRIRIHRDLRGFNRTRILLHEMFHAAFWPFKEGIVRRVSRGCSVAIYRAGCDAKSAERVIAKTIREQRWQLDDPFIDGFAADAARNLRRAGCLAT